MSAWYAKDGERIRARVKTYYAANLEEIRARDAARYERDKVKRLALATDAVHRRRARISDSTPDKGINHLSLRDRDGPLCHLCDKEMSFKIVRKGEYNPRRATIEHLVPLCAGGTHTWDNVALTCWACNLRRPKKIAI